MPAPIPAPLPPWARFLVQVAPYIGVGLQASLEYFGEMFHADDAEPDEWRLLHLVAEPVTALHTSDIAITTLDVVNITGGRIDSSWTDADYTAVQATVAATCGDYATKMSNQMKWKEVRYYRRAFTPVPVDPPTGDWPPAYIPSGPPERVMSMSLPGQVASHQASQVAITSTLKTTYPAHWGRNYWPRPTASMVSPTGYIGSADVDYMASLAYNLTFGLAQKEFFTVVPVTQIQGRPARGLLGVTKVQVDNVWDVQRRRRLRNTTYRKQLPA